VCCLLSICFKAHCTLLCHCWSHCGQLSTASQPTLAIGAAPATTSSSLLNSIAHWLYVNQILLLHLHDTLLRLFWVNSLLTNSLVVLSFFYPLAFSLHNQILASLSDVLIKTNHNIHPPQQNHFLIVPDFCQFNNLYIGDKQEQIW
jgi:hypothetical protein